MNIIFRTEEVTNYLLSTPPILRMKMNIIFRTEKVSFPNTGTYTPDGKVKGLVSLHNISCSFVVETKV